MLTPRCPPLSIRQGCLVWAGVPVSLSLCSLLSVFYLAPPFPPSQPGTQTSGPKKCKCYHYYMFFFVEIKLGDWRGTCVNVYMRVCRPGGGGGGGGEAEWGKPEASSSPLQAASPLPLVRTGVSFFAATDPFEQNTRPLVGI